MLHESASGFIGNYFRGVPRGTEHRTLADAEAEVLIFEPANTLNTGNITDETFTAPNGVAV